LGELSNDAGGMIREWMTVLISIFLSETTGLFTRCDTHEISYKIKENSNQKYGFREMFLFLGKLIGKSLFDRIPLNLCFAKTIYKNILNDSIELEDVKYLDGGVLYITLILLLIRYILH